KNKLLPDIYIAYFQGRSVEENNKLYPGFTIGMGFPLWFGAQKATINASQMQVDKLNYQAEEYKAMLLAKYSRLQHELDKYQQAFDFYDTAGKTLAIETVTTARKSFEGGEINFLQFVQATDQAVAIEINHLLNLYKYNLTVIEMNYLID
ncbi:MAG: TolC family protein, partial [Cyclobacteriaceae bacterium]|nr:TolC family protein [Cyclobacteriaceae bacterium]